MTSLAVSASYNVREGRLLRLPRSRFTSKPDLWSVGVFLIAFPQSRA